MISSQIIDDGYQHVLMVFEDAITGGYRLHAAVWDGKFRACPVWTAFSKKPYHPFLSNHYIHNSLTLCFIYQLTVVRSVPPNVSSSWLIRKTSRRIWLRDIQPYVFFEKYRPAHQRRGRLGAFELAFAHSEAASRFHELFASSPVPSAASVAHDSSPETNDTSEATK